MREPRYTVGSVTGYPIAQEGIGGRKKATIWYVHDRLYGYRILKEFKSNHLDAETRARALAAELNVGTYKPPDPKRVPNSEKTHCKHGHELTPWNTYVDPRGYRSCRKCAYDSNRRSVLRKRSEAA